MSTFPPKHFVVSGEMFNFAIGYQLAQPLCLSDWEEERAGGNIDARRFAERMAAAEAVAEV